MEYEKSFSDHESEEEELLSTYQLHELFLFEYTDKIIDVYTRLNTTFPYIFQYGKSIELTELLCGCYGVTNVYKTSTCSIKFYNEYITELKNSFSIINIYLISKERFYKTLNKPYLDFKKWCDFCYTISLI